MNRFLSRYVLSILVGAGFLLQAMACQNKIRQTCSDVTCGAGDTVVGAGCGEDALVQDLPDMHVPAASTARIEPQSAGAARSANVEIRIPAGAVKVESEVSIEPLARDDLAVPLPEGYRYLGGATLGPRGMVFEELVELRLYLDTDEQEQAPVSLFLWDDETHAWTRAEIGTGQIAGAQAVEGGAVVHAYIDHFSKYVFGIPEYEVTIFSAGTDVLVFYEENVVASLAPAYAGEMDDYLTDLQAALTAAYQFHQARDFLLPLSPLVVSLEPTQGEDYADHALGVLHVDIEASPQRLLEGVARAFHGLVQMRYMNTYQAAKKADGYWLLAGAAHAIEVLVADQAWPSGSSRLFEETFVELLQASHLDLRGVKTGYWTRLRSGPFWYLTIRDLGADGMTWLQEVYQAYWPGAKVAAVVNEVLSTGYQRSFDDVQSRFARASYLQELLPANAAARVPHPFGLPGFPLTLDVMDPQGITLDSTDPGSPAWGRGLEYLGVVYLWIALPPGEPLQVEYLGTPGAFFLELYPDAADEGGVQISEVSAGVQYGLPAGAADGLLVILGRTVGGTEKNWQLRVSSPSCVSDPACSAVDEEICTGPDTLRRCFEWEPGCLMQGTEESCLMGNPCVAVGCEDGVGCVEISDLNDVPCDDDDPCTVGDFCQDGVCAAGEETLACDDGNACTVDGCQAGVGCDHEAVVCDDEDACTTNVCDAVVGCRYLPVSCDDGDACTTDVCDSVSGCTHDSMSCDDGNVCTTDACLVDEGCTHVPISCDDDNVDTADSCDPASGCVHAPVGCDDQDVCTVDTFSPTTGCDHTTITCDDANDCTVDTCDTIYGCQHTSVSCDDGDACTTDACSLSVGCFHGTLSCMDDDPCTMDECDSALGCVFGFTSCDDGDSCTTDSCVGGVGCQHVAVSCDDGNSCTTDVCDSTSGCFHSPTTEPCDDGNLCTTDDKCREGECLGHAWMDCDDGDVCTSDECDPLLGCLSEDNSAACDDDNPCTEDSCDAAEGCANVVLPDDTSCGEGAGWKCASGVCVCTPSCEDAECGDDGCGGSCGACLGEDVCVSGECVFVCEAVCEGMECGDDGCGGACGVCSVGTACHGGTCDEPPDCTLEPRGPLCGAVSEKVYAADGYAYFTQLGSGIRILQITSSQKFIPVSAWPVHGRVFHSYASNVFYHNYETGGLDCLDVSSHEAPQLAASFEVPVQTPDYITQVIGQGSIIYYVSSDNVMYMANIASNGYISVAGSVELPFAGSATAITATSGAAYVSHDAGIIYIDTIDPSGMAIKDSVASQAPVVDIDSITYGFNLAILYEDRLEIRKADQIGTIIGSYYGFNDAGSMDINQQKDIAYITDIGPYTDNLDLEIIDFSYYYSPQLSGVYPLVEFPKNIFYYADKVYINSSFTHPVQVYDVADASSAVPISAYGGWCEETIIDNNIAICSAGVEIYIYDITDEDSPAQISDIRVPIGWEFGVRNLALDRERKILYSASYWPNQLHIWDVSDYHEPGLLAVIEEAGSMVLLRNNMAIYSDDDNSCIGILDVSDPTLPYYVGGVCYEGVSVGQMGEGDHVFSAHGGLTVVDISIPSEPRVVADVDVPSATGVLAVVNEHVFIETGNGIEAYDVRDPEYPIHVGSYALEYLVGSAVQDGVMLISRRADGWDEPDYMGPEFVVSALDLSDPASIQEEIVGGTDSYGPIAWNGDRVVVGGNAVVLFDIGPCWNECGVCGAGQVCEDGVCVCGDDEACCLPQCLGRECGDDGCGGFCGGCVGIQDTCIDGHCVCQPSCEGNECGPDGCGGSCGACTDDAQACDPQGLCCTPDCSEKVCGGDGCGGYCGACGEGSSCMGGACNAHACADGMCLVPDGTFFMGCDAIVDPDCTTSEPELSEVSTVAFKVDEFEVTANQYTMFLNANGTDCDGHSCLDDSEYKWNVEQDDTAWVPKEGEEQHPARAVTWSGANAYCAWQGKRLCTEAEWEKAARGTDARLYPWGNELVSCEYAIMDRMPGSGCGTGETWPVGSKPAGISPYGAYDMAGNVEEWVAGYVRKGGDLYSSPAKMVCSRRKTSSSLPEYAYDESGFRCCVDGAP